MAVKSRDNVFDKPFKMLDLLRNAKWENSFLSKIALFTHSLKKVIPTFLLKTFEFISFIIKGRDNKKVVIISKERTGGGLNKGAIFSAPLFSTLSVFPN